jgi:two-component system response regulator RegX3
MKKKILYVEDDEDTRILVKEILEEEGYEVTVAANGEEGLSKLEKEGADLVLLDIITPGMSGWDVFEKIRRIYMIYEEYGLHVCEKMKETSPLVKVAFISILPITEDRLAKLRKYGVSDYIMKPFDNEELVRRIRRILGS